MRNWIVALALVVIVGAANIPADEVLRHHYPQSRLVYVPEWSGADGGWMTYKIYSKKGTRWWATCRWTTKQTNLPRNKQQGRYRCEVSRIGKKDNH